MAELLGVVAGGAGVLSLAIQLASAIRKVNQYIRSIRDTPREVYELIADLEILADTLAETEHLYNRQAIDPLTKAATRALDLCKELINDLQTLANELEQVLRKSDHRYGWKVIKATTRKRTIEHMRDRVPRALQYLLNANQIYFQ